MMSSYVKKSIMAGIILFIWGMVSWMFIPWHNMTLHSFKDSNAVVESIQSNATQGPGIYLSPSMKDMNKKDKTQSTLLFVSYHPDYASTSMALPMLISLAGQMIAAFFVAFLLSKTSGLNYFKRVGFVMVFALAASLLSYLPYWNWFHFDTAYTLVGVADILIGWYLAALVLAKG